MKFAPAYMYLIRFAEKLFATSSFHFNCLGRHNPNCMTYVPPTLNVLFPCTPPSSPHRWRSRFLRDRNYAINYFAPYLSFLSLPFFVFFSNYCRRYSWPQSQIWEIIKKCSAARILYGTQRNRLRQGRITSCFFRK